MRKLLALLLAIGLVCGTTRTQEKRGKASDAEAMVKKAVAFFKANGKEKALAEISDTKGKFVDGDLYVFVYDLSGKCVAHGGNPKMVGKDLIDLKDADGKPFVKERIEIIKSKGKGWQNYKWSNPVTKAIEDKTAYIEKVDDLIVGCGAYK
jgi:cytochrome c